MKKKGALSLTITQKAYDMTAYGYICLRRFPKSEKYAIAADIKAKMYTVLELIITANNTHNKWRILDDLDVQLDLLRLLIRLAHEVLDHTSFPVRSYEHWSRLVDEVGRMLGGWKKSLGK